MVDQTQLTPFERLHYLLAPPSSDADAQNYVHNNPTLHQASQEYVGAIEHGRSADEIKEIAVRLARDLTDAGLGNFNPNDVSNSFDPTPYLPQQQNEFRDAPQQQQQPSSLFGNRDINNGGGGSLPEKDPLLSLQEEILVKDTNLLELLKKAKDNPDNLKDILAKLNSGALLQNQQELILGLIKKYLAQSSLKLTEEQTKTILHEAEQEFDGARKRKDYEGNENLEEERARNEANKKRFEQLLQEGADPEALLRRMIHDQQQLLPHYGSFLGDKAYDAFHRDFQRFYREEYEEWQKREPIAEEQPRTVSSSQSIPPPGRLSQPPLQTSRPGAIRGRGKNPLLRQGLKKIGTGLAKKLAERAIFTQPWFWIVIAILFVVVIVVIILIIVISALSQQSQTLTEASDQTAKPASCAEQEVIDNAQTISPLIQGLNQKYHILVSADPITTELPLPLVKSLYTQTCLLFGNIKDNQAINGVNTFGKYASGNLSGSKKVSLVFATDASSQDCSSKEGQQSSDLIQWRLTNFDLCNEGRQRFLLGKTYASIFLEEQDALVSHGYLKTTLFPNFTKEIASIPRLPTTHCYTGGGISQNKGCFSDMVGSYFSYPLYFDKADSFQQKDTSTIAFSNLPSDYPTYYDFARTELFDGSSFFNVGHPKPPNYPSNLQQAIYDTFGVQANGLRDYEYRWLWEKLWDVSNTKFISLIKPAHITIEDDQQYATTGCRGTVGNKQCTVTLHHWNQDGEDGFKVVITHEFSHAIDSTNPDSLSHKSELEKVVALDALDALSVNMVPNGWLTWYGELACFYHPPTIGIQLGEDYAETIAYYLNPNVRMRTACQGGPPPYSNGAHQKHYRLAREILGVY